MLAAPQGPGRPPPSVHLGVVPMADDPSLGELVVRGATVTAGYWNRPEATVATVVDAWLHTGDIVRVDDAGRVHIVDRIKDIMPGNRCDGVPRCADTPRRAGWGGVTGYSPHPERLVSQAKRAERPAES